ncbi:MAG: hypothetical protein KKE44_03035 [Proteobacteria bacterium]|nr:hypothetical protein [Pseudomonadota bacterium]MBU1581701.1 hypothetical protein [Pseudomonadota bacterium]MBU2455448.1 hypothetical protein [Pseudomonadota bacterium]
MEAFITGIGWVSKESMGHATRIQRFDRKASLPSIKRNDILNHPYKPFGRMDAFSKLGFAAIAFAMKDAGIKEDEDKKNISIIASTITGCLETDIHFQETMVKKVPSPAIFAYTLASCFLGEACIYFGLTGESFVINEDGNNGLTGLVLALDIIDSGESDTVLCGVCNLDIQTTCPISPAVQPGSLFFVIEKKALHSYGSVKSISLERIYYQNDHKITGLFDLAQKCTLGKI